MTDFHSHTFTAQTLREHFPRAFELLFIDRTKTTETKDGYIIWGNDNYKHLGEIDYAATASIYPWLIYNEQGCIIIPRALKSKEQQKERTKSKAEVFTPTWIVKKQNDALDENYKEDTLKQYVGRTWLEITCGEAPYMASRYHMETGEIIPIAERVGFIDRKMKRVNAEVNNIRYWKIMAHKAYESSYGFEWNGDSLLLARQNLLLTFIDYYVDRWQALPLETDLLRVATIISYNVFQMDGLKYIIPFSDKDEAFAEIIQSPQSAQPSLFDDVLPKAKPVIKMVGQKVKIKNWKTGQMEYFEESEGGKKK